MRTKLRGFQSCFSTVLLLTIGACDLSPTIPSGAILDDDLNAPEAAEVIFNGMVGDLEYGLDRAVVQSALATPDEIAFAGTRLWYDMISQGDAQPLDVRSSWETTSRARWTSEHGILKLESIVPNPDQDPLVTAAHVWAGYSLRIMGDVFCEAVFDGGSAEPNSAYYERALEHFRIGRDRAVAGGSELDSLRLAAIAGMAQSNLILQNYSEAAQLAAQVPDDFVWVAHHSAAADRERNYVWMESHLNRMITVFGTPVAALGPDGDPRVPWKDAKRMGNDGISPLYYQMKYAESEDDVPLAKGLEMRLIEAEVMLRNGDLTGFSARVNNVRAAFGLDPVTVATAQEAWSTLDWERFLTLWLEGRRLKDVSRFSGEGLVAFPGGRAGCFPFGDTEIAANPNLH